MHHYRSREEETPCGGDPYFYLRLSTGPVPYNPIKLEVDVKPEPCIMTPVSCLQQQQPDQRSPSYAAVMQDTSGSDVICKSEESTTAGIGLLALTQLDGFGGGSGDEYKSSYSVAAAGDGAALISSCTDLDNRVDANDDDKAGNKIYLPYDDRLVYTSPPGDIKHQVFDVFS